MLRSVLTIMQGSALAQAIGFMTLPLLSRSFDPAAFGYLQVYQSITMLVIAVLMLRYEIAILRAADGPELNNVLALCVFLTFVITALLTAGFLSADALRWTWATEKVPFGWWWISLAALAIGWMQIFSYLATRDTAYGTIASAKVAQGLGNAGAGIAMALTAPISSGLIIADLAGRAIGCYAIARGRLTCAVSNFSVSVNGVIAVARRYRDLSLISLPGSLMNTTGIIMTPLLIYATFDAAMAGQYGLVERAVGLPVALIVGAVSQVHMGNLAEDLRAGTNLSRNNFRRLSLLMAGVALLPTILGIMFAPTLFNLVFGPGWDQAAHFAQILAPAYFLAMISGGINMTLTILGRQALQLMMDAGRLGAMLLLWIYAPREQWPIEQIVMGHALLLSCFSIIQFVLSYRALPTAIASSEIAKA